MENEQTFEAGVSADRNSRHRVSSSRPSASLHEGRDNAVAAGAIDPLRVEEDTPLLAGDETVSLRGLHSSQCSDEPSGEWSNENVFTALPWWKRPSVFWLLPSLLVHTLTFGGIIVPKLTLILNLICRDYLADQAATNPAFSYVAMTLLDSETDVQCRAAKVQELVSKFSVSLQLASAIPSILMAPKLGSLSDRYGRTKILAFTGLGVLINEMTTILAAKYPETFSVNWLLVGSVLDGLCGTFITSMAVTSAYASDCYPPSRRSVVFGWIYGCLFTGVAIGPFLAGLIIQATGSVLAVFYIALAVHALFLPYILLIVPESVIKERQLAARQRKDVMSDVDRDTSAQDQRPTWKRALSAAIRGGGLFTPLSILWPTGARTSSALRRNLVLLASVDGVMFGVAMGSMTVVVYYLGYMFDWGPAESSYFIALVSTCRVLVLLVVLPIITRVMQDKHDPKKLARNTGSTPLDISLIQIAVLFDTLGFVGYALAGSGTVFLVSGCVTAFGSMGPPTLQSSLTKHVPADRTGQLLGAIGLLHGVARVVAPVIFNMIYAETVAAFPQTVFVCLASMFGVAGLLSLFIRPHVYFEEGEQAAPKSDIEDEERERSVDEELYENREHDS